MLPSIRVTAVLERHSPGLPRYVAVPSSAVAPWRLEGTTTVEGSIDGWAPGRRSLKRWDAARWFLDLPESLCRRVGIDTGDRVRLDLRPASSELPGELASLLSTSAAARRRWEGLTASRQRMIREHVAEAKRPETRERRARKALGPNARGPRESSG